ncbi:MAG: caspase family protein [Betaproteobacteria bacterium]|nr:caspase family protein [Betaproteobacteria bacterium]
MLVVAHSCYAGTLTRSVAVEVSNLDGFSRLAQKRARTALVSGGLAPVADAGFGGHSVFAKAFLDSLRANPGVVDMSQVFSSMRRKVIVSAQQTPQCGDIGRTGHEGGDFIFVRRQ